MSKQENILKGVEISKNADKLIVKVPLLLTQVKLDVLVEVAKA
jgi:hypothetical protein